MTLKKKPTVDWFIGQWETDGTFLLNIRNDSGLFNPSVKLASKSNTNTLKLAEEFFSSELGITVQYEKGKQTSKGKRAPFIKFGGKNQVLAFIKKLRESKLFFTGVKYRDALIMEIALTKDLAIAQKIGLKKSLHKQSRNDPDLKTSSETISREKYEARHSLAKGDSYVKSESLLRSIDILCALRRNCLIKQLHNDSLFIPTDYIKGLVDGDGNFNVGTVVRNGRAEWNLKISIALDANSECTAEIFKFVFKSNATVTKLKSTLNPDTVTSLNVALRNTEDVHSVLAYFNENGACFGDLRSRELSLANQYLELKTSGDLKVYEIALKFAKEVYDLSEQLNKGRERTPFDKFKSALKKTCES